MKRLIIALCLLGGLRPATKAQVGVSITYQQFYNELEPYGEWINYPQYGYVWEPYFERPGNFTPYSSGGHWVYTEDGWTWASDYDWGWATFHYGRWFYDDYLGWLWIPGYDWAPAWVTWGSYGGNYGWAPLGPGISISVGMGWRPPRSNWWTFVPCNRFGGSNWNQYIIRNNTTIVNHVTVINNVYTGRGPGGARPTPWMRGPRREEVEHFVNRPIRPVAINNVQRPGPTRVQNNSLTIYRPVVNKSPQAGSFRPNRAQAFDRVRPQAKLPGQNDRRDNNPGNNRPVNRPGNPAGAPPAVNPAPGNPNPRPPANPGNRPQPGSQHDRPDRPYPNPATNPPRPETHPGNPRPETRPVNPGTRPENRPALPPQRPETRPVTPPAQPNPRPDNPVPERPAHRPQNHPPVQPGNRPANPNPAMPPPNRPAMPPGNRPGLPPNNNPGTPPPNRPAMPPHHNEPPRQQPPPATPPQRKND